MLNPNPNAFESLKPVVALPKNRPHTLLATLYIILQHLDETRREAVFNEIADSFECERDLDHCVSAVKECIEACERQ